MALAVTFVSGPRRCGKTALIQAMVDRVWGRRVHYVRLNERGGDKCRPSAQAPPPRDCGVASARWIEFDPTRVFELLPQALGEIARTDPGAPVVIEAENHPALRCAYPYDHRIFVMNAPVCTADVFRPPTAAARELQKALDDTMTFASEMFGLLRHDECDGPDPGEDRPELSATQMRGFLYSPLGDELATRIQLQPAYHGLVESDVVVVNANGSAPTPSSERCLQRIERLFERLRPITGNDTDIFVCDPRNHANKVCKQLFKALAARCVQRV